MHSLLTFLLQLSGKAWAALAVLCGGAAIAFYFSPANADSNSIRGHPTVAVQAGNVSDLGLSHPPTSIPVVPETNPGLVLIPVVAAMLLISARRLWAARPSLAADDQNVKGTP